MKALKEILIVILSIVAFVSMLGFLFLFSTQNIISKQNVANVVERVEIKGLIGEEGITELDESLKESGLPEGMAEDILDNKEFKRIVGEYTSEIFNSILLSEEVTTIDSKEFAKDLNDIVDIVVKEARNSGVEIEDKDIKSAHEEITKNSEEIVSEVNNSIIEAKKSIEENPDSIAAALKTVRRAYKNKLIYLVVTITCIVISCLLKIKNFEFVSYLRNIGLTYGIILIMIGSSIKTIVDAVKVNIGEYEDIISGVVTTVPNTFLVTGVTSLVIGISCLIGYIYIKKNNANKVAIENSSI